MNFTTEWRFNQFRHDFFNVFSLLNDYMTGKIIFEPNLTIFYAETIAKFPDKLQPRMRLYCCCDDIQKPT
jgi:hypothetical protein